MSITKYFRTTSGNNAPLLDVISGIHKGVSVPLDLQVCCLGASANDDIVLRDAGVHKSHATLRMYGNKLAIEATGGDVCVDGQWLTAGVGCRATFPVTLSMGEASLRLQQPKSADLLRLPKWSPSLNNRLVRNGTMGGLVFIFAGAFFYQIIDVNAGPTMFQHTLEVDEQPEENTAENTSLTQAHVVEELTKKLNEHDLNSLNLRPSDRRIIVSGNISPDKRATWTTVHQWFDSNYGRDYMLSSAIDYTEPSRPDINFQAVWVGETPYIISEDGKRHYAGASLIDGWVIDGITAEQVMLRRGDDRFNLTL